MVRTDRPRPLSALVLLSTILSVQSGCSILLPRHPRSHDIKGESVTIRMLDCEAMQAGYAGQWKAAFPAQNGGVLDCSSAVPSNRGGTFVLRTKEGLFIAKAESLKDIAKAINEYKAVTAQAAIAAAPIVAAAAGFAVDYIKKQLEEEATRYSAQFEGTAYIDNFWTIGTRLLTAADLPPEIAASLEAKSLMIEIVSTQRRQHYFGFEMTRTTKEHPGGGEPPAFRLVAGIAPSTDQQVLLVAPLLFETQAAKAKVLDARWWTWVPIPYGWALDASDEIETKINLELTATWRTAPDRDKKQVYQTEKIFGWSTDLPGQDLNQPKPIDTIGGKLRQTGGWFGTVPISYDLDGVPVGTGTATLRVLVTEHDPSNAKKALEQAADAVGNQKETVVKFVSEQAKGGLD